MGAEVGFTLRPRNCRPRIIEREEDRTTCEVTLQEHQPLTPQTVQVETSLLSVHTGTVTFTLVPGVEEEAVLESMMEEVDADALTPVPHEQLSREPDQSMYDSTTT